MSKDLDLIIFAMDGTLYPAHPDIDSFYPIVAVRFVARITGKDENEARAEFLIKKEQLATLINGKPTNSFTLFWFYDVDFQDFEDEIDRMIPVESLLKPDHRTIEVMDAVSSHYRIFLFTTNNDKVGGRILRSIGLHDYFPKERRFSFSDVAQINISKQEKVNIRRRRIDYLKPSVSGLQYILNRMNVAPGKALMVGDSFFSDIAPAQKLGMPTYHVRRHSANVEL